MPFHEDLLLQLVEALDGNREAAFHLRKRGDGLHAAITNFLLLHLPRPTRERLAGEIPRKADAGHEHDGALAGGGVRQLGLGVNELVDLHFPAFSLRPAAVRTWVISSR